MKNRIAELRTSQAWSQAQLAELLSITRQTVIAIEQSKTDPSLSTAMRVGWLFRKPVESIFLADLDEQMIALNEAWEYKKKTATALNEMGVLEQMGEDGWEMTGFGAAALHFRRPENTEFRRKWEYKRVNGLLTNASRAELEKQLWSFLGSWMGAFHYFKREARPGFPTN
jgi:DNA-binding XRE family transcriptional regulator